MTREELIAKFKVQPEAADPIERYYGMTKSATLAAEVARLRVVLDDAIRKGKFRKGIDTKKIINAVKNLASQPPPKPKTFQEGLKSGVNDAKAFVGRALPFLGIAGGMTGAAFGADYIRDKMHESAGRKAIEDSYSQLEKDKELRALPPGHAKNIFDSLAIYAPEIAAKPNLAKNYILGSYGIETNGLNPNQFESLGRLRWRNEAPSTPDRLKGYSDTLKTLGRIV